MIVLLTSVAIETVLIYGNLSAAGHILLGSQSVQNVQKQIATSKNGNRHRILRTFSLTET